jgi:hypothetical protein
MDTTRRSGYSKIIRQSVPNFILDEYPLFADFLEAYYEWLDQYGNPIEFLQNGGRNFDIDTTADEFLKHFKSIYLEGFPKNLAIHEETTLDERTLIKNIREFYKIKGNEKSIELLFKIITDSDTTIEYPRDYIFMLSSGNYKDYHQIYLLKDYTNIANGFDVTNLKGLQVNQYEGLVVLIATATIEDIYETTYNGKEYYVLRVSNPTGTFIESDFSPIQIEQDGVVYSHYPVPAVSHLSIVSGGSGYNVGEFFTIGSTGAEHIRGFISGTDENGKISKVRIFSNPVNYGGSNTLVIDSPFGTGGSFSVVRSILSDPVDEYLNNKNLLSKVSRIQDSFEYQQFSYVVKSKRSFEEYTEAIKQVIHPAGFVVFNALYDNIGSIRPSEYLTRVKAYEKTSLGAYARYSFTSNTGAGSTLPWNVSFPGDLDPTRKWGYIFSFWPGKTNVNPNDIPSGGSAAYENGKFIPIGVVNNAVLPNDLQDQFAGITYWMILPHPATRGVTAIPPGISFGAIKLNDFLQLPVVRLI